MRIVLLGYMGSGKTTIGQLLAETLSMRFLDLDQKIEKLTGKKIREIFEKKGETYFRKVENNILKSILRKNNVVIAAGGGTPCFYDNMDRINKAAVSIFLDAGAGLLYKRLLSGPEERPLLKEKKGNELKIFIRRQLAERKKYYLRAQHILKTGKKKEDEIVRKIICLLEERDEGCYSR